MAARIDSIKASRKTGSVRVVVKHADSSQVAQAAALSSPEVMRHVRSSASVTARRMLGGTFVVRFD